jgi:hypothetical protein
MVIRRTAASLVLFALGAGCSDSKPHATPPANDGAGGLSGDVSCATDERVDTYTAGLRKEGESDVLSFAIVTSEPAPPAKGSNAFEVEVADSDGAAQAGDLRVSLFMPDHGHGTSVTPVVTYDEDTGRFTLTPLYLFMAGVWRITFEFRADPDAKAPLDRATFFFCIEG